MDDDIGRPQSASVARNTVLALAVQLLTAAFTAALTLVLVRVLDSDGFGILALAVSIGSLLLIPIDFGISHAAARFVAEQRDDGRSPQESSRMPFGSSWSRPGSSRWRCSAWRERSRTPTTSPGSRGRSGP